MNTKQNIAEVKIIKIKNKKYKSHRNDEEKPQGDSIEV